MKTKNKNKALKKEAKKHEKELAARRAERHGLELKNSPTRFHYFSEEPNLVRFTADNRGNWPHTARSTARVVSLATRLSADQKSLQYQVAVCMPTQIYVHDAAIYRKGDTFSRKIGRTIAQGRLETNPISTSITSKTINGGHREILKAVLLNAVNNKAVPLAARKVLAVELAVAEALSEYEDHTVGSVQPMAPKKNEFRSFQDEQSEFFSTSRSALGE